MKEGERRKLHQNEVKRLKNASILGYKKSKINFGLLGKIIEMPNLYPCFIELEVFLTDVKIDY